MPSWMTLYFAESVLRLEISEHFQIKIKRHELSKLSNSGSQKSKLRNYCRLAHVPVEHRDPKHYAQLLVAETSHFLPLIGGFLSSLACSFRYRFTFFTIKSLRVSSW